MGICAIIYPYKVKVLLYRFYSLLYSSWILHFISGADRTVYIQPGLDLKGGECIIIGAKTNIGKNCILNCWTKYGQYQILKPHLTIGKNCNIGNHTHITCANRITIGDNLLTGRRCLITDNAHGNLSADELEMAPAIRPLRMKGEVCIGNNVWLGERVTVCSGVHIGDGVVVAADAVVTHDIPAWTLAAGIPAKIIKTMK